jgi:hypothetical protein
MAEWFLIVAQQLCEFFSPRNLETTRTWSWTGKRMWVLENRMEPSFNNSLVSTKFCWTDGFFRFGQVGFSIQSLHCFFIPDMDQSWLWKNYTLRSTEQRNTRNGMAFGNVGEFAYVFISNGVLSNPSQSLAWAHHRCLSAGTVEGNGQ